MAKKWISVLLLLVYGVVPIGSAFAQSVETPAQPDTSAVPTPAVQNQSPAAASETVLKKADVNDCIERGRTDGSHVSTGGSFFGGFVGGLLLGLIGTGVAYVAQGEPNPPTTAKYSTDDAQCRMAYSDAFGEQGKKKKRSAALTGGLVGTGVLVVILLAASSSSQ